MLSPLSLACVALSQALVHLLVLALALVQRAKGYMVSRAFFAEDGWWTSLSTDAKMVCKVLVIHVTFWN